MSRPFTPIKCVSSINGKKILNPCFILYLYDPIIDDDLYVYRITDNIEQMVKCAKLEQCDLLTAGRPIDISINTIAIDL